MHSFYEYRFLPARWQTRRRLSRWMIRWWCTLTVLICLLGMTSVGTLIIQTPVAIASPIAPSPSMDQSATTPAALFEENCAGCHVNGGNVIRRGKNLKKRAMTRNGYESVDAIAQIITHGKGIMSAYGERLNEEEIGAIAKYVHEQSESGW